MWDSILIDVHIFFGRVIVIIILTIIDTTIKYKNLNSLFAIITTSISGVNKVYQRSCNC